MQQIALLAIAFAVVVLIVANIVRIVRYVRRSSEPAVLSPSDRRLIDTGIGLSHLSNQPPRGSWGPGPVLGAHTRRAPAPSSGHSGSSVPTSPLDGAFGLTYFGRPAHLDRDGLHPVIDGKLDESRREPDPRLDDVEGPEKTQWWLHNEPETDSESSSPEPCTVQSVPFAATVETHPAPEPVSAQGRQWWESAPAAASVPAPEQSTQTYCAPVAAPVSDPAPTYSAPASDSGPTSSSDTTSSGF